MQGSGYCSPSRPGCSASPMKARTPGCRSSRSASARSPPPRLPIPNPGSGAAVGAPLAAPPRRVALGAGTSTRRPGLLFRSGRLDHVGSTPVARLICRSLRAVFCEDEDLRGHVGVEMNLRHEGDHLATGDLLDGLAEGATHRHLEGLSRRLDLLEVPGLDQRPLGGCVDVLQEDNDPVAVKDRAGGRRSASIAIAVESCDRVPYGYRLARPLGLLGFHLAPSPRFPVIARKVRSGAQPGGRLCPTDFSELFSIPKVGVSAGGRSQRGAGTADSARCSALVPG